jgi:hypothetical protein
MIRFRQLRWTEAAGWTDLRSSAQAAGKWDLVLVFGGRAAMADLQPAAALQARFPGAILAGCSTAGEIAGTEVSDEGMVATALAFDSTRVELVAVDETAAADSFAIGGRLAGRLPTAGLVHVLVLADGIGINGSELVRGLEDGLPAGVSITGGLAGDGARFRQTLLRRGSTLSFSGALAIGLYSDRLRVGYGSLGGWDPFGPERRITRSRGNILFELDSRPALDLYRLYLGEHAAGLPATGLLFPLSLRSGEGDTGLVRTIVGMDEDEGSLTFVGDVPEGHLARLMRANLDRLIDGAAGAATATISGLHGADAQVALLISCVGRKMILNQRVEEEVEAVRDGLGPAAGLTGFYSYGEIAPALTNTRCELHNQTMTITAFAEV